MEGEQGGSSSSPAAASTSSPEDAAAAEQRADGAALSDSFSQLWSDVMGMLVSFRLFCFRLVSPRGGL